MTQLPDWLVERIALEEVPPAMRSRVDGVDAAELSARVSALRDASLAELASYPAGPAVSEIEARVVRERARHAAQRRRRFITLIGVIGTACVLLVAVRVISARPIGRDANPTISDGSEITRAKGAPRVLAFRQAEDHAEPLVEDALVKSGDVIQLRYKAEGAPHGVIASIDGAGEVTLHYPATEKASTALAAKATSLPHSYALDDAPGFERFFFVTCDEPIDVVRTLNTLRRFAQRADSATAEPELSLELSQWSLRLRKPNKGPTQ